MIKKFRKAYIDLENVLEGRLAEARRRGTERETENKLLIYLLALHYNVRELLKKGRLLLPIPGDSWVLISLPGFRTVTFTPTPVDRYHGTPECLADLEETYSLDGFAEIEVGDTVFDVGAYIGSFSRVAAQRARRVIAIEPNALMYDTLDKNLSSLSHVEIVPMACWHESGSARLNLSITPFENSLLDVDVQSTATQKQVEVELTTVCDIAREHGISRIDFLKIEAEGVEPEILRGALEPGGVEVGTLAINCGPERNGKTPTEDVLQILDAHGYEHRVKTSAKWENCEVVFAIPEETRAG